ncbi:MAG: hypothetical protein L6266_03060, partial [Nanoarchaeota archaeon]|nr:hypothetical protein [Nanoarchaeota archaeon]
TVIIIGVKSGEHEIGTSKILASEKNTLKNMDLLTLLRSPAMQVNQEKEGLSEVRNIDFAELFSMVYLNYPTEQIGFEWLFNDFIDRGLVSDSLSCESNFKDLITETLGYTSWSLRFYSFTGKQIFECDNLDNLRKYAIANGYYAKFNTTIPSPQGKDIFIEMEIVE